MKIVPADTLGVDVVMYYPCAVEEEIQRRIQGIEDELLGRKGMT